MTKKEKFTPVFPVYMTKKQILRFGKTINADRHDTASYTLAIIRIGITGGTYIIKVPKGWKRVTSGKCKFGDKVIHQQHSRKSDEGVFGEWVFQYVDPADVDKLHTACYYYLIRKEKPAKPITPIPAVLTAAGKWEIPSGYIKVGDKDNVQKGDWLARISGSVFTPANKTLFGWASEHFGCVIRPVKKKKVSK